MTFKKYDWRISRFYKKRTIKFGRRSIHDIIKDENLDFCDKVDYIRHHYTYYEGNYDLFHDKRGKGNNHKEKLNKLICDVIHGEKDPSDLKKFNKVILRARKMINNRKNKQLEKELERKYIEKVEENVDNNSDIDTEVNTIDDGVIDFWLEKCLGENWQDMRCHVINAERIKNYLHSKQNVFTAQNLICSKYKTVKGKASAWENEINMQKFRDTVKTNDYYKLEMEKYKEILKEKALQS